mmetsp:Transcript_23491/g.60034  ORF Transcript_23491/g.60034 Transcript_23491/m.60034 type:complete len:94 (+) Transcript_23491:91-372(+)
MAKPEGRTCQSSRTTIDVRSGTDHRSSFANNTHQLRERERAPQVEILHTSGPHNAAAATCTQPLVPCLPCQPTEAFSSSHAGSVHAGGRPVPF